MKITFAKLFLSAILLFPVMVRAQQYSNNWYKVSGGGGTSTNGPYSISGTIGQQDAGGPMVGAGYSVMGGFWAIDAVQTAGLPPLNIRFSSPDSAIVFWLDTGSYYLQTNSNLSLPKWVDYGGAVATSNGTNSVTITPPKGNLFFRLSSKP